MVPGEVVDDLRSGARLVEVLFTRSAGCAVILWPPGRLELRGVISLDGIGEAALQQAAGRGLSPSTARAGPTPCP